MNYISQVYGVGNGDLSPNEKYRYPTAYLNSIGLPLNHLIANESPSTTLSYVLHTEILFNILINNDINIVKSVCMINKNALRLCQDQYFWHEKFKYHHLLIMSKVLPQSVNDWLKEYKWVSDAYDEARTIINVNKVESSRQIDKTDGIIKLSIPNGFNPCDILDEKYWRSIISVAIYAGDHDMIPFIQYITLKRINNDYQFEYHIKEIMGIRCVKCPEIDLTNDEILNIIIQVLYHNHTLPYINITDWSNIPFTKDKLYINHYQYKTMIDKRIAILDTLKILNI